jgi:uncharacterized protein (DUF2147 family)
MLWKKIWPVSLLVCLLLTTNGFAKTKPDECLGYWFTEKQDATIEIYKNDAGKYEGKIVWLKDLHTGKKKQILDDKNEDESRHDKPILGMVNLKNFIFDNDDEEWQDGTVYDPENGKTYSAYMKMKGGKLHLRGYVGISLFGRTNVWTREEGVIPKMFQKK